MPAVERNHRAAPAWWRSCVLAVTLVATAPAADLAAGVERLLAGIPAGGRSAVVVFDLSRKQMLYRLRGAETFAPASLVKLFVSAAALLELGPDWRWTTRLVALGPVQSGTVPGLGVIADGDPCLDTHFYAEDPAAPFRAWAKALRDQGITRIAGDLVIDRSAFAGPERPTTWPQDHENRQGWYSAPASPFAWNDNCLSIRVTPNAAKQPCRIELRPRSERIVLRNATISASGRAANALLLNRDDESNALSVTGTFSRTQDWFDIAIHSDADLLAADHFAEILRENGIALDGRVRTGTVDPSSRILVEDGHALGPAVTVYNQHSQNFYGEQIIRALARHRGQEGSIQAGTTAVGEILRQHLGADYGGFTLLDGCGLSYETRITADTLARLLAWMDHSPLGDNYRASLKPSKHGAIIGQVKTGTLAIARCYAGYLNRPDGTRVCFVILLNRGESKSQQWMVGLRDKLCDAIAAGL